LAKHLLNSGSDLIDFVLIGISSPEDQYTLVANVDLALGINLVIGDFVPYALKEGRIFEFSLYQYTDEELGLPYYLIPNTSNFEQPNLNQPDTGLFAGIDVEEKTRLIKELPKTDYFLLLKGEDLHNYQFQIIEKLRPAPGIMQVTAIEPEELPSKRNLIF
jgi:hypothetical protein